jgi:hypothetical protein
MTWTTDNTWMTLEATLLSLAMLLWVYIPA